MLSEQKGKENHESTKKIEELLQTFLEGTSLAAAGAFDVRFKDLVVVGAGYGAQKAPTVVTAASRFLQRLNPRSWVSKEPITTRILLNKFSGTIRGGEMLLVLGKPGSGCTTFLKTVANMRQEYHATEGDIFIGGDDVMKMKESFPGEFAFSSEDDIHFPSLSVGTTLRFSVNARTPKTLADRSKTVERSLESLLSLFGLSHTFNTRVGDDYQRGVSGGERHRVTVAEALSTRAGIMCLDNPTKGLDSSTASKVIQVMRSYTDQRKSATIMSVYQASDAMAKLFDKVLIINSGREIYFGPVEDARSYFESLGFYYPPRTTLTDFLTTMSGDPRSRIVRRDFSGQVPISPEDFETAFQRSRYGHSVREGDAILSTVPQRSGKMGYTLSFHQQVYQCTVRQTEVQLTNRGPWIAEGAGLTAQALMLGTVYWNQQSVTRALYTRAAALFFNVMVMILQAAAEFGNTFSQRPILLKHNAMMLYHPTAYAIGQILAEIPWKAFIVGYNLPVYWMANFQRDAGSFFTWFIVLYCTILSLAVMFRTIAVFTISPTRAILPVGLLWNVFILYTGFYVTPPSMKSWLGWLRWINPMYYSFEAVMVNEVSTSQYRCSASDTIPFGAAYTDRRYQTCAVQGFQPGDTFLRGEEYLKSFYDFKSSHLWRNVGIMLGFFLVFSISVAIGMARFKVPAGHLATVFFSTNIEKQGKNVDMENQRSNSGYLEKPQCSVKTPKDLSHVHIVATDKTFAWKELSLDAKTVDGTKRLLHNVSACLTPGSMTALMGVSGAGKTTLLNMISQRARVGLLSGSMFLGDRPVPRSFKRRTGFVHQQDVHLSSSTVREALRFVARLRQPATVSVEDKDAYVEAVLSMLEMEVFAEALIGVPGAGLNLEKRKRVSIGVELAAKPDIVIFFDEPTSGLDGDSALSIVRLMRKLANAGLTILCTIHQPAAQLTKEFDSLLLLTPGGKTAYFGPLGPDCSTVLEYFARHSRRCEPWENPAEYFLSETVNSQVDWHQVWESSEEYAQLRQALDNLVSTVTTTDKSDDEPQRYAASMIQQLQLVMRRAFTDYWRDPDYVIGKIHLNLWMALINSLTYLQLGDSMTDSRNKIFSVFVSIITGPIISLAVEPRFTILRDQYLAREKDSNSYHWFVFVSSAVIVEIPWAMITGFLYWCMWYYSVAFPTDAGRAAYAFLMYELFTLFITGISQAIAASFPTIAGAHIATGFIYLVINTFTGPLSPPPLTPRGWRWIYNISPLFYFCDSMVSDVVHSEEISCKASEINSFFAPDSMTCADYAADYFAQANSTGYLLDPSAMGQCDYCQYLNGDEYIRQYNYAYSNRADNVGIFIGFIMLVFVCVFVATYLGFIRKWRKT